MSKQKCLSAFQRFPFAEIHRYTSKKKYLIREAEYKIWNPYLTCVDQVTSDRVYI